MSSKTVKIVGYGLSLLGAGIGIASDYIGRKTMLDELLKTDELKEVVTKVVEQALKKQ